MRNIKLAAEDAGADGDLSTVEDNGGFAEDYFTIVNNINDAPETIGALDTQVVLEDQDPEYLLAFDADELFYDIDGDLLTLDIALADGSAAPSGFNTTTQLCGEPHPTMMSVNSLLGLQPKTPLEKRHS